MVTINYDSNIEVIFEDNPKYTQFRLIDHTLRFKNILPSLTDLFGVEDGVWRFIDIFNKAFTNNNFLLIKLRKGFLILQSYRLTRIIT